jgi:hypothetical protein
MIEKAHEHHSVQDCNTRKGNETDSSGYREWYASKPEHKHPAGDGEGNAVEHEQRLLDAFKNPFENNKNHHEDYRNDEKQPFSRRGEVFELATPFHEISLWHRKLFRNDLLRIFHEAHRIAIAQVDRYRGIPSRTAAGDGGDLIVD